MATDCVSFGPMPLYKPRAPSWATILRKPSNADEYDLPSALPACMRALTVRSGRGVHRVKTGALLGIKPMARLTRVRDTRGKELGDGAQEEEVEVGQGRDGATFGQPRYPPADDKVLELLKELQVDQTRQFMTCARGTGL